MQFGRPRCVFILCHSETILWGASHTTQMADHLQRLMFWYSHTISELQTPFSPSSKSASAFICRWLHHNKNKHTNAPYIARASSVVWRPWRPTLNTDTSTTTALVYHRHGTPAQRYTLLHTVQSEVIVTTITKLLQNSPSFMNSRSRRVYIPPRIVPIVCVTDCCYTQRLWFTDTLAGYDPWFQTSNHNAQGINQEQEAEYTH
jgi:hypothetical protein